MTAQAPPVRRQLEPTHPCIRCGREGVPADSGLCELCNPLELAQPSATQMHGIAAVGIIAFIVVLAVAGRAALAGTGPFAGQVVNVTATSAGLAVTITVKNEGSTDAATTCLVSEPGAQIGSPKQVVQTPLVRAGESVTFTADITKLGTKPIQLQAECQSP